MHRFHLIPQIHSAGITTNINDGSVQFKCTSEASMHSTRQILTAHMDAWSGPLEVWVPFSICQPAVSNDTI